MSFDHSAPTATTITSEAFEHILTLYSGVLESLYHTKIKADDKKREQALTDDVWRYDTFPNELRGLGVDTGFTLKELERLVRWKITHQKNRPFLLPQIRKNDASTVKSCTAEARRLLGTSEDSSPPLEAIRSALDKICELKGVGPATGTLVLSVFKDGVPFFEDELYAWLLPDSKAKLKYNVKEYLEIFEKLQDIMSRPNMARSAQDFEKVAYICEHWDLLGSAEKTQIAKLMQGPGADDSIHNHKEDLTTEASITEDVERIDNSSDYMSDRKGNAKQTKPHRIKDSKSKRKASAAETADNIVTTPRRKRARA